MMTSTKMPGEIERDEELVQRCLSGDREAFAAIVVRYQSLICSLAYSATGSLTRSEDLAQETFVTAWRQLSTLREPAKLRAWLSSIARRLTNNAMRRDRREPVHAADPLERVDGTPTSDSLPGDQAISAEEKAILWRSLQRIPEAYREPLILFYREHQSVERVAEELELSVTAVKTRLSRGRGMLKEQVAAFVDGALKTTAPGKAFTTGVLAALPVMAASASASAATLGAATVKGASGAKAALSAGWMGAVVGPIVGLLGAWFGVRNSLDQAQSSRERRFIWRMTAWMSVFILVFAAAMTLPFMAGEEYVARNTERFVAYVVGISVTYMAALMAVILFSNRRLARIRREESSGDAREEGEETKPSAQAKFSPFEYRSAWTFLGLPLIHVRLGHGVGFKSRPAVGWIAVGDLAVGIILSCGGVAVGGISMGGAAVGLVSMGGAGLGVLSMAGLAMGYWAAGGVAVGYLAIGGCALGWQGALGGLAWAHEFALGGAAVAAHANDPAARTFLENHGFMSAAQSILRSGWISSLSWLPILLVVWMALRMRRRLQPRPQDKGSRRV